MWDDRKIQVISFVSSPAMCYIVKGNLFARRSSRLANSRTWNIQKIITFISFFHRRQYRTLWSASFRYIFKASSVIWFHDISVLYCNSPENTITLNLNGQTVKLLFKNLTSWITISFKSLSYWEGKSFFLSYFSPTLLLTCKPAFFWAHYESLHVFLIFEWICWVLNLGLQRSLVMIQSWITTSLKCLS